MRHAPARPIVPLVLAAALAGTVPARAAPLFEAVVVTVDLKRIAPHDDAPARRGSVRMADLRPEAERALGRTTLGDVSLGAIRLDPPAPAIVQAVVEAKADAVLGRHAGLEPPTVHVGLFAFEVATPVTPLYWDVRVRIDVGLRVQDRLRRVTAAATDRTFLWPSQDLVTRVTTTALERLGREVEQALEDLVTPPR